MLLNCGVRKDSWDSLGESARRSNQSIPKEISPGCSFVGLILKLNLQYFGHLMRRVTHLKRSWCWEGLRAGREGDDRGWDDWMASPTLWTWVWVNSGSWSLDQVAKLLEFQLLHQTFQWTPRTDLLWDILVWSSCCPRDSQESSPTTEFRSIISSVLSFLYSPTLISIHDYWKNHSFDQTDFCWQSNISTF